MSEDAEREGGSVLPDVIEATGLPAIPKAVRDLLMKVAAPGAEELGLLLADGVAAYRLRNQVRMLEKTLRICEGAGIDPESVPLRTLAPLLDGAGWEDDDSLQDMWASLLASAAEDGDSVPPAFVTIMHDLSPTDARLLRSIFAQDGRVDRGGFKPPWPRSTAEQVALENVARLGLVHHDEGGERVTPDSLRGVLSVLLGRHRELGTDEHVEHTPEWVSLTSIGEAFLGAATRGDR